MSESYDSIHLTTHVSSVLQYVAVCCSVLQCVAVTSRIQISQVTCMSESYDSIHLTTHVSSVLQYDAACCSVLQGVAVCCSILHYFDV